jgi:predicted TPR repeat methyltransferase
MSENSPNPYADYDQLARQNGWHPEALFGLAYEYLKPGDRLLDIGTGSGLAAEPFARAGAQVYVFDSSPEMLALFRAKGITTEIKQHDLLDLPWPYMDGTFDYLLACGVLHFLPDLEPVFGEAKRLLRPGGIFVFTSKAPPDQQSFPYFIERIQDTTLYLHQPAYLEGLLDASGLSLRKVMRMLIRTGRGTEDVFQAWVMQKVVNG